ncbi:hypothetical protein DPV54_05825, partial [Campylobacter coli]|nr:hypothetical protein [Campylobacter coli]
LSKISLILITKKKGGGEIMKKLVLFLFCLGFAFACSEHSNADFKDHDKTKYNSQYKANK